jgi:renin receptor
VVIVVFFTVLGLSLASGEFLVLHAPNHVNFLTNAKALPISEVPDVISSSYGFQLDHVRNNLLFSLMFDYEFKFCQDLTWDGLGAGNLFKRPKANVVISVSGLPEGRLLVPGLARYSTEEVCSVPLYKRKFYVNVLNAGQF